MSRRRCTFVMPDGALCRSSPLTGEDLCLFHSPAHAEEAQEARRLGGLRRRREKTLLGAYDFAGLGTVPDIQRLLEIATLDTLSLENSVSRVRALTYICQTGLKCLEAGELEDRLAMLEAAVRSREVSPVSDFDLDLDVDADGDQDDLKELTP